MHNGKKSQKTGKVIRPPHNDTDREKNENVKKEWVKNNIYYNYYDGEYTPENQKGKMPFREAEIAYYNEHYKDALYAQNERHIKARQKNRVKSMEDWLDSPRYAPTESILRIGNVDDGFVCVEDLKKMTDCYIESLNDWSMNHGDCLHILNYAIHADEYYVDEDSGEEKPSSHHVHIRYVFDYIDEKGNKAIGIEQALKQAGYELPKPEQKEGRCNNRLITFTKECRDTWQQIAQQFGYDIEIEPLPTKRKSKDKQTYVAEKRAQMAEKRAKEEMEKAFAMQNKAAEAEEKAEKETEKALAMQTEATEMKETAEQQIRECQILSEEIVRSAEQIQEVAKQQQEANEQLESKRKELEQQNEIVLSQRKQELEEEYAEKEAEMNYKIALADKRSEAAINVYNKSKEYRLKINEFVKSIKDDNKRTQAETEVKKINSRFDDYELDEQVKLIKQKQMWDKGMSM